MRVAPGSREFRRKCHVIRGGEFGESYPEGGE